MACAFYFQFDAVWTETYWAYFSNFLPRPLHPPLCLHDKKNNLKFGGYNNFKATQIFNSGFWVSLFDGLMIFNHDFKPTGSKFSTDFSINSWDLHALYSWYEKCFFMTVCHMLFYLLSQVYSLAREHCLWPLEGSIKSLSLTISILVI